MLKTHFIRRAHGIWCLPASNNTGVLCCNSIELHLTAYNDMDKWRLLLFSSICEMTMHTELCWVAKPIFNFTWGTWIQRIICPSQLQVGKTVKLWSICNSVCYCLCTYIVTTLYVQVFNICEAYLVVVHVCLSKNVWKIKKNIVWYLFRTVAFS